MKKLLYILLLLILSLNSCEEYSMEFDPISIFFSEEGISNEQQMLWNYEYLDTVPLTIFYEDNFNNPDSGIWSAFNDEFGKGYYLNGRFLVKAKKGHSFTVYSEKVNYDQNKNFQIEFLFYVNNYGTDGLGFIFNKAKNNNGYKCLLTPDHDSFGRVNFKILNSDYENENDFVAKDGLLKLNFARDYNSPYLLTIRKLDDQIVFFIDKKFILCKMYDSSLQPSGIAYIASEGSLFTIEKIIINYFN